MGPYRNILILISDEHRRDAMGCAGHPIAKTPHLDGLATRGTLFSNAYTPSPMCVPARAAIATGQPVHNTRHWDSASPYAGSPRSWMHDWRDRGMDVASIGKLHFKAGEDHGFTEEILPMHVAGEGWTIGLLREDPVPFDAVAELAQDVGVGESDYTRYDRQITDAAEAWLSDAARKDRPWTAFVSLVSPHYPLTAPEAFASAYDPTLMDAPRGMVSDHPEVRNVAAFFDYARHFDDDKAMTARAAYYGLVSFMDDCVGRVLAALKASGQADDTLILYCSDHGEMLGDHGLWTKQVMYEASVGVPMILAGPGVPKGHVCETPVSLLDIAPTVREKRGLIEIAQGPNNPDRTVFSEYHDGGSKTGTFMVRWDKWKYVHYVGQPPQLFDLQDDPKEDRDLGALPDHASIRAEGEKRLRMICDPKAENARAFADQAARIDALGGVDAVRQMGSFNHTPAP